MNFSNRSKLAIIIGMIIFSSAVIYAYGLTQVNNSEDLYIHSYVFFKENNRYISTQVNLTTFDEKVQLWTPTIENNSGGLFTHALILAMKNQNKIINFSVLYNNQIYTGSYTFTIGGIIYAIFYLEISNSNLVIDVKTYSEDTRIGLLLIEQILPQLSNNISATYPLRPICIGFINLTEYTTYTITARIVNSTFEATSMKIPYFIQSDNFTNFNATYYPYAYLIGFTYPGMNIYNITVSNGIVSKSALVYQASSKAYEIDIIPEGTSFQLKVIFAIVLSAP